MNILIASALESEVGNEFVTENIIFTGVGKINAAYSLTKAIYKFKPDIVFNLGTAGSTLHLKGSILLCTRFHQRDMDASPLGFPKGITPYSAIPEVLAYGVAVKDYNSSLCGTGDSFNVDGAGVQYDAIDMEAYALALVCKYENIPFICIKYITDNSDSEAAVNWLENLTVASKKLYETYIQIRDQLPVKKVM